jgi:hypothetical protein
MALHVSALRVILRDSTVKGTCVSIYVISSWVMQSWIIKWVKIVDVYILWHVGPFLGNELANTFPRRYDSWTQISSLQQAYPWIRVSNKHLLGYCNAI